MTIATMKATRATPGGQGRFAGRDLVVPLLLLVLVAVAVAFGLQLGSVAVRIAAALP